MANRQGDVDLRFVQVSAPVRTLVWLGLGPASVVPSFKHSFVQYNARRIKNEETMPDCPVTMPRGPGTTPLSRTRFPAAHSPASAPAATTHHVSPTAASNAGEGPVTSTDPDY